MIIKINENEKRALIELIDVAVKSGGLRLAEAGVVLAKKISEAIDEPEEKPENKPEEKTATEKQEEKPKK